MDNEGEMELVSKKVRSVREAEHQNESKRGTHSVSHTRIHSRTHMHSLKKFLFKARNHVLSHSRFLLDYSDTNPFF